MLEWSNQNPYLWGDLKVTGPRRIPTICQDECETTRIRRLTQKDCIKLHLHCSTVCLKWILSFYITIQRAGSSSSRVYWGTCLPLYWRWHADRLEDVFSAAVLLSFVSSCLWSLLLRKSIKCRDERKWNGGNARRFSLSACDPFSYWAIRRTHSAALWGFLPPP